MVVQIVNQPDLRIAGIRHIGPYQEIGREFGRLGGLLKGPPAAGSQMIALYHDDPAVTPPVPRFCAPLVLSTIELEPAFKGAAKVKLPAVSSPPPAMD